MFANHTLKTLQKVSLCSAVSRRWFGNATKTLSQLPRTMKIQNGEKVQPTFSAHEMSRRHGNLRHHMERAGLDACVLTSYHNVYYFSDFLYCKMGRNYAYVVTPEKATSISACVDYGLPWRRTFGDNVVYTDWHEDNFFYAVKHELGDAKHIGLELDVVPFHDYVKFSEALPSAKFVDVGDPTMRMRMIKSDEEIELIKQGARIADLGGEAARKVIREGISEYEVGLVGIDVMVKEIAKTYPHQELRDTWLLLQSGEINSDGAHNSPTSRQLQKGDIMVMNCFPMPAGYHSALERTLFLDHVPSDRHMELWEINCEVYRRGLELIKPGVRCCDIADELNDIYLKHNLLKYRTFGYGHSFGVLSNYYGREAALELREDIETALEPNMVLSMEPSITIPYGELGAGTYREHDVLIVHEDSSENITNFPVGPDYNIVKN